MPAKAFSSGLAPIIGWGGRPADLSILCSMGHQVGRDVCFSVICIFCARFRALTRPRCPTSGPTSRAIVGLYKGGGGLSWTAGRASPYVNLKMPGPVCRKSGKEGRHAQRACAAGRPHHPEMGDGADKITSIGRGRQCTARANRRSLEVGLPPRTRGQELKWKHVEPTSSASFRAADRTC